MLLNGGKVVRIDLLMHEYNGHELNMSVTWDADPCSYAVICAAGAVVDELYGHHFIDDPDELAHHRSQDKAELLRLCTNRGFPLTKAELDRCFELGLVEARGLFASPVNRLLAVQIRDWIHSAHESGESFLDEEQIKKFVTELGIR